MKKLKKKLKHSILSRELMRSFCLNGRVCHRPFTYAAHLRTHVDYTITGAQAAGPVFSLRLPSPRRPFFHPRTVILLRPAVCANSVYKTRMVNLPATIRAVFVVGVLFLFLPLFPSPFSLSLSLIPCFDELANNEEPRRRFVVQTYTNFTRDRYVGVARGM